MYLYVSDDGAGGVVDEFDADLSHTSSRAGSPGRCQYIFISRSAARDAVVPEDSRHLDELDWLFAGVHDFAVVVGGEMGVEIMDGGLVVVRLWSLKSEGWVRW
jgi:hypothetical protein